MAKLYITEFRSQGVDGKNHGIQQPEYPPEAEQVVAIGATSASSAALNARTAYVRLHTDAICSVAVGAAPAATTSSGRMAANETRDIAVPVGSSLKIAVITNT